jgi:hypothetical protein
MHDQLHAACDKLFTETDYLDQILDADEVVEGKIDLALSVAKRVRRESTIVVRELARIRDNQLQP